LAPRALINFNLSQDLAKETKYLLLNKLKLSLKMKDESAKAGIIPTSKLAKSREGNRTKNEERSALWNRSPWKGPLFLLPLNASTVTSLHLQ
jgi:hypothetical protein